MDYLTQYSRTSTCPLLVKIKYYPLPPSRYTLHTIPEPMSTLGYFIFYFILGMNVCQCICEGRRWIQGLEELRGLFGLIQSDCIP